jgi:hypothetical protein
VASAVIGSSARAGLRTASLPPRAQTIPSISPFGFVTVSIHDYNFDEMMSLQLDFYENTEIFHRRTTTAKHEEKKKVQIDRR